MSLKRDHKTRSSISRFIAALLRPFMSEPPPPQLPCLLFHSPNSRYTEGVVDWRSRMTYYLDDDDTNCYAKCFLRHIEYCKCSQGVEHEFLVFYFGHWTSVSSALGVICADRTVNIHSDNSSSSGPSSGLVSPSSADNIAAQDTVTIMGSPHDATRHLARTFGSFNTLCTLKFSPSSPPSALQVSVVLSLVNGHSRNYHMYERQCYWFADTVWKSLKRLFPENEELCVKHKVRYHCGPFNLGPSDESVDEVCGNYEAAWNETLEQMREARRRRAAQQERFREIGWAERQREIDEIQAQAQQRERDIQAQAQQREREIQAQQREWEMQAQQREREIQAQQREREMQAQQREREMQAQFQEMLRREAEKTRAMEAEIQRLRGEQAGI